MPRQTKQPDKQPPQTIQNANAAVVPPPNPVRPPSTLDQVEQPELNTHHVAPATASNSGGWALPHWVWVVLEVIGIPLLAILLVCAALIALKQQRRRRRRTLGSPSRRFASGWRDLVDYARDLGLTVTLERTRGEQAGEITSVGSLPAADASSIASLAAAADAGTFARGIPGDDAATAFWDDVDAARRTLGARAGRWTRLRAALTLGSFTRPGLFSRRPAALRRTSPGAA